MKSKSQSSCNGGQGFVKNVTSSFDGVQKTALLLSTLDPQTASKLLALFEPEVAQEIVQKAKEIENVPPENAERILSEFLDVLCEEPDSEERLLAPDLNDANTFSFVADPGQYASNFPKESPESRKLKRLTDKKTFVEGQEKTSVFYIDLDVFKPAILANILEREHATIGAAILTRLSRRNRTLLEGMTTREKLNVVSHMESLLTSAETPAIRVLENVLFEKAIEEDRSYE